MLSFLYLHVHMFSPSFFSCIFSTMENVREFSDIAERLLVSQRVKSARHEPARPVALLAPPTGSWWGEKKKWICLNKLSARFGWLTLSCRETIITQHLYRVCYIIMIMIIIIFLSIFVALLLDIETVQIFVSPLYRYNIQRPHITRFDCVCILFGIGQWREKKKSVNAYHTIFIKKKKIHKRIAVFFFFIRRLFVGRQQTRKFWEKSCADIVYYIICRRLLSFVRDYNSTSTLMSDFCA